MRGRNSDNTLIQKVFGWEPDTRLRDGMAATYKWIEGEYLAKYGSKTMGIVGESASSNGHAKRNGKAKVSKPKTGTAKKAKMSGKKKSKSKARGA